MVKIITFFISLLFSGTFAACTVWAEEKPIHFAADKITSDTKEQTITASGHVILFQEGASLRANRVIFYKKTGVVDASGDIIIQDKNGNISHMDKARLEGNLREGFISNARILFSDGARLVARDGVRVRGKTTLNNAIYSPCDICFKDGPEKPLWQIRADEITHDETDKLIRYKNVFLEIKGIPVFYTPYLSHPDPSVRARSGLLAPTLGRTTELGVYATIPYHFDIAPHRDFTFEPIITSNEGVVFGGTYRQHTGNGQFSINGSLTNVNQRDENFQKTGDHEVRSHIFSEGQFDLNSLGNVGGDWQWDYAFKWVSDDTYLRRYYDDRSDVLESHAKIERFSGRDYATFGVYGFQGLDEEDVTGLTAQALPSFNVSTIYNPGFWGSQLNFDASGVAIYRSQGSRSRRVSARAAWKLPMMSPLGDFYTLTASVRGDLYNNSHSDQLDLEQYIGLDGTYERILPKLAFDWRMPFVSVGENIQQVIEPLVSIIIAPTGKNPPEFANEDSRNFEFDENNLFSHNRFNGHDLWESGTRMNYGIRYSLYAPRFNVVATLGQSFRLNSKETFPVGSGYEGKSSDFVGRLDVTVGDNIDYVHRFRLDNNSLALRRNEMILSGGLKWFRASVRYLDLDRDSTDLSGTEIENRREFGSGLKLIFNDRWTMHGSWVRDLLKKGTVSYDAGIIYKDECLEFGLSYERRFTTDRDIAPSNSFHFRLILKNLG